MFIILLCFVFLIVNVIFLTLNLIVNVAIVCTVFKKCNVTLCNIHISPYLVLFYYIQAFLTPLIYTITSEIGNCLLLSLLNSIIVPTKSNPIHTIHPMLPSEKDTKFDRQLRLWGSGGQSLLENAHIALIGATSVGCELLKDLILPNIGKFTIIDDQKIKEEDISSNFFIVSDSMGQSRAKITKELLNELNEDVQGNYIDNKSLEELLKQDDECWNAFTIVIASGVKPSLLIQLSSVLHRLNIPLVVIESMGFFGYLLISIDEHTIIESHPSSFVDLRLDKPWPELIEFVSQYNLDDLDDVDIAHVPYIVILLKTLDLWKKEHDGNPPKTSAQKREFKKMISSGKRVTADGENYNEAMASSWRLFTDSTVPSEIIEIVNDKKALELTNKYSDFWVLVATLREFISLPESNNSLPVTGVLPDMTADTVGFVKMQKIYREKAKQDIEVFHGLLKKTLEKVNRPADSITREQVETFCKNSRNLKVIRGSSLQNIYNDQTVKIEGGLASEENERFGVFLAIETAKHFYEKQGYYLGRSPDNVQLENDLETAKSIGKALVQQLGVADDLPSYTLDVLKEIARAGCYELHNISSFLGGIGSQEIVKIITKQYTLLDNLMVFDGVVSKGQNWKV